MKCYTTRKKLNSSATTPLSLDDFPQDILRQIVWHLPAYESARTTILAPNWKDLWLSNPNWDLTIFTVPNNGNNRFEKAVTDVITRHNGTGIEQIRIANLNLDGSLTGSTAFWMEHLATNHPLAKFDFDVRGSASPPPSLFSCTTLVDLRLSFYRLPVSIPSRVRLPNLKRLSLKSMIFQSTQEFKTLLKGCWALEFLNLDDIICTAREGMNVELDLPELKEFKFRSIYNYCYVYLLARKLEIIQFRGLHLIVPDGFFFGEMKEVRSLEIEQWVRPYLKRKRENNLREFGEKMNNRLNAFRDTKALSLGPWCIEHLTTIAHTFTPPIFQNLTRLEMSLWPNEGHISIVLYLLMHSPILGDLKLITGERACGEVYLNEKRANYPILPNQDTEMYGRLTHIEMKLFRGTDDEMKLVASLLTSCPALELFSIKFAQRVKQHMKKRVRTKAPELPRACPWAELTISNYTLG